MEGYEFFTEEEWAGLQARSQISGNRLDARELANQYLTEKTRQVDAIEEGVECDHTVKDFPIFGGTLRTFDFSEHKGFFCPKCGEKFKGDE